jgi:hypothetical protein
VQHEDKPTNQDHGGSAEIEHSAHAGYDSAATTEQDHYTEKSLLCGKGPSRQI